MGRVFSPLFWGRIPQRKHAEMPVAPPLEVVGQSRILGEVKNMSLLLFMTISLWSNGTLAVWYCMYITVYLMYSVTVFMIIY